MNSEEKTLPGGLHSESTPLKARSGLLTLLTRMPRLSREEWQQLSWPSRWLVMSRSSVLVMTMSAVLLGILLAAMSTRVDPVLCTVLVVGLSLAHASNNLINDWVDHLQGIDKGNYFRGRYGTHVLEEGLVSNRQFVLVTVFTGLAAIACGFYVVQATGVIAFYFALAGAFFVLFYTWPLKHLALGELAVFLVWGPLLSGGSYYVLTGELGSEVLLVSLVSGMGPTLVILAKHIDKFPDDAKLGVRSLPVMLGLPASKTLTRCLLLVQWAVTLLLIVSGHIWLLTGAVALPLAYTLFQQLGHVTPATRPEAYPRDVWPLWYVATAFRYSRAHGVAMIAGLSLNLLF